MARVFLRPRAERDLREISDYIAERSGDERAAAVLQRLARMMRTRKQSIPIVGDGATRYGRPACAALRQGVT